MSKPRNLGEALASTVRRATAKWAKTKKSEERHPGYVSYRRTRMTVRRGLSQKDAMEMAAEPAYMAASASDTLPATSRQCMYAARPMIEKLTGKRLDDQYFCQTLLPDYIEENGLDWDVVFDARGHFTEPQNGGKIVNLGTLDVRSYLADIRDAKLKKAKLKPARVSTCGPDCSFGAVVFVEKEGFQPLFERVELARRHDIAIMSTKGVSVTAARLLVDRMCSEHNIPLMVLHDLDVAGFTILDTLRRDTRRYQFEGDFKVIDLGLRLQDVQDMGLQPEAAARTKSSPAKIRARLMRAGATPEECEFLLHQRVGAECDDQRATHRVHRAQAGRARHQEDRPVERDAGRDLSAF